MISLKNKKAGEKILSIWWFAILILIGTGVVLGTLVFFSKDIDVRKAEADILANKLALCLVNDGKVTPNLFTENFDLFKECSLSKSIIADSEKYFISITTYKSKASGDTLFGSPLKYGNIAFEKDCAIEEKVVKAEHFPRCTLRTVYGFNETGAKFKLEINAGSNYEGAAFKT